jgi:hypothetical protein
MPPDRIVLGACSTSWPLLALYLFFLPKSGAGAFGLKQGGWKFTLYLLLINLPFGIVTALVARAIIGQKAISFRSRMAVRSSRGRNGCRQSVPIMSIRSDYATEPPLPQMRCRATS